MTDAFSTPAEHAFDHPEIEAAPEAGPSSLGNALSDVSIEEAFEVQDTIRRIIDGGYKTVRFDSSPWLRSLLTVRLVCSFRTNSYLARSRCSSRFKRRYRLPVPRLTYWQIVHTEGEQVPHQSLSHGERWLIGAAVARTC